MTKKNKRKHTMERDALFHARFREDIKWWVQNDRSIALRALELVEAILSDPFIGIGRPEALRYDLSGAWSRCLTREHLTYAVSGDRITFLQARYHY